MKEKISTFVDNVLLPDSNSVLHTNFIQHLKTIREVKCQHSVNKSIIRSTNLTSFAISCKPVDYVICSK